jgi:signal-transduction protein with cAMP-binding, CBS, and nucleotidyltransferase domain
MGREETAMKVKEIYRPLILSAEADDPLSEVASRMEFNEVGALAVFRSGVLVGIVTERDLVRAMADDVDPDERPVADYMTEDPVVISTDADIHDAQATMSRLGVRHLPVAMGGQVIGMLSARDLLASAEAPTALSASR